MEDFDLSAIELNGALNILNVGDTVSWADSSTFKKIEWSSFKPPLSLFRLEI